MDLYRHDTMVADLLRNDNAINAVMQSIGREDGRSNSVGKSQTRKIGDQVQIALELMKVVRKIENFRSSTWYPSTIYESEDNSDRRSA